MIDLGNNIDIIFMYFAKAFDKVPHVRLGRKLESHGITAVSYTHLTLPTILRV